MAATFVQVKGGGRTTAGTVVTLAYTSANTATNLLVCMVSGVWNGSVGVQGCTVTDSNGNTWTARPVFITGDAPPRLWIQAFYVLSARAGANTVTITCSSSNIYVAAAIAEYGGFSAAFDAAAGA